MIEKLHRHFFKHPSLLSSAAEFKDAESVHPSVRGVRSGRTQQQELPAVPVELPQVDAELVDGGAVAVLVEQGGKLLDLLR